MLASHFYEGKIEAGCDEAGRGCLAGSVYAAAVILPDGYQNELLNDSKQLSEKKRYQLREIIERDAVALGLWALLHLMKSTRLIFSMPLFLPCIGLLTN